MTKKVRVRFAPSPTGPLHIGGVRTALFNYLFAKKNGGDFILRIEDTDQTRFVPGAEDYIVEAFDWLGLPFDESPSQGDYGPYRQSERKDLYKKYVDRLIDSGHAYYAFDTAEELDDYRKTAEANGDTFIYNWHNRLELKNSLRMSSEETQSLLEDNTPYVIRFKSPENEDLVLNDIIRGEIRVNTSILDDKVLFKSDGMPTYHMANIVDDHLMEITHVIRGEEWLPSLPLHVLLYRSLGWEAPEFAHLPLILKPTGKGKLSKRDGDKMGFPVFPLAWEPENGERSSGYREDGYLPDAVINMLAFLGWNPGTEQELFTLDELVQAFDLTRVQKGGAKFDPEKTRWFQHQYYQKLSDAAVAEEFEKLLASKGIVTHCDINRIAVLLKERATFTEDLWDQGSFFFEAPQNFDEKAAKKAFKENTSAYLTTVKNMLENQDDFTTEALTTTIKGWIVDEKIGFGNVMMPLRLSLVGEMKGPDVFDIMAVLGKNESIRRITHAINYLS